MDFYNEVASGVGRGDRALDLRPVYGEVVDVYVSSTRQVRVCAFYPKPRCVGTFTIGGTYPLTEKKVARRVDHYLLAELVRKNKRLLKARSRA